MSADVKHPLVRDLERLVCWVNTWADEAKHREEGATLETWRSEWINRERKP